MDQYYIDEGYYDEGYFVYIAEAQSGLDSSFGVSAAVGVIRTAAAEITAEFTQTATISHIEGADLFAFTEASIAVAVDRIRDNNILAQAAFDIATDGRALRTLNIEAASQFDLASQADRSRATTMETQAAFSLTAELTRTAQLLEGQANITAEFTQTAAISKTLEATAGLSSQTDLTATISHILGVDIVVENFADLTATADKIKRADSALTSAFEQTAIAAAQLVADSIQSAEFTASIDADRIRSTDISLNAQADINVTVIRIRSAQAEVSASITLTALAVKQTDIQAPLAVEATVSASAVKTVNAIPQLDAIASQLTAAAINATGTVLLESTATMNIVPLRIKPLIFSTAIGVNSDSESDPARTPYLKYGTLTTTQSTTQNKMLWSFWAYRPIGFIFDSDSNSSYAHPNIEDVLRNGLQVENSNDVPYFVYWAEQGQVQWQLAADRNTLDTQYRHYLLCVDTSKSTNAEKYRLFLDGQELAQHSVSGTNFAMRVYGAYNLMMQTAGSGIEKIVEPQSSGYGNSNGVIANRASLTQFWWDYGADSYDLSAGTIQKFYNNGYRLLGADGTATGLDRPKHFVNLSDINDITDGGTEGNSWSWRQLTFVGTSQEGEERKRYNEGVAYTDPMNSVTEMTRNFGVTATLTAIANTDLLFAANTSAVTNLSALVNFTAVNSADLDTQATLSADVSTRIGILADLSSQAELATTALRIQSLAAALSTEAELSALVGVKKQYQVQAASEFVFEISFDVKLPIRTEAFMSVTAELQADITTFTDNDIQLQAEFAVTAEATLVPPIRIDADLTAEFTLTATVGSIEQFAVLVMSAGSVVCDTNKIAGLTADLASEFTTFTDAGNLIGAVANITSFGAILAVIDAINIDPFLQLKILPETRRLTVTKETRTLNIASESRTLIIEGFE